MNIPINTNLHKYASIKLTFGCQIFLRFSLHVTHILRIRVRRKIIQITHKRSAAWLKPHGNGNLKCSDFCGVSAVLMFAIHLFQHTLLDSLNPFFQIPHRTQSYRATFFLNFHTNEERPQEK